MRRLIGVLALAAAATLGATVHATAQSQIVPGAQAVPPLHGPRIEINPRRLLYRRCVDWYELQYRPSGTVLYPQMRCWWVRG
jgi:hypothetical protein